MKPSVTNPDVLFMDLTKEVDDDDDDATDKVQDSDILRDHEDVSTNKTEIMTALASVKEKQEPPKKRTKLDHLNIDQQSTQLRNSFKELQREKKRAEKKQNELYEQDYDFGMDFWSDLNDTSTTSLTTITTTAASTTATLPQ